jgi:hypothetical protein
LIKLVRGRHTEPLLDELTAFPNGAHDDCVDALSGAHKVLSRRGSRQMTVHVPRGRIPVPTDGHDLGSPRELATWLRAT